MKSLLLSPMVFGKVANVAVDPRAASYHTSLQERGPIPAGLIVPASYANGDVLVDTDMEGHDLGYISNVTEPSVCHALCHDEPSCAVWSLMGAEDEGLPWARRCYLKTDHAMVNTKYAPGHQSGIVKRMDSVPIPFGPPYNLEIPTFLGWDAEAEMRTHLRQVSPPIDTAFVVTEKPIWDVCNGARLFNATSLGFRVVVLYMKSGEKHKSFETLGELTRGAFREGVSKRSVVIPFGGGVVLNVGGLLGASIYRGIRMVHVPTTLMAQHDVITSLKTAVNVLERKNNFGVFHPSILNLVDVSYLRTLPRGEFLSGMGELAKNALIIGGHHATDFHAVVSQLNTRGLAELQSDHAAMLALVKLGIEAKAGFLKIDPKEKTTAMIFEYGHTLGHALERSYADGVLPHGVAVCWGMLSASYFAQRMDILAPEERVRHDAIIKSMLPKLPTPLPTVAAVRARAMMDSKRGVVGEAEDEFSEVLLSAIGTPLKSASMLHAVKWSLAEEWLLSLGLPAGAAAAATEETTIDAL
jgi:3-dehydroquinate synthase/2-deoxy-scyllo-inosose synthase